MAIVEASVRIAAPVSQVYRISQDYAVRYDWDPFPDHIEVVGQATDALRVGTQVRITSKLGMHMLVQFVQLQPPERAAVTMLSGPWMLAKFAGSWIFLDDANGQTQARFRYTVVTRPAMLRWLIEPLAVAYFERVVHRRLAGLKAYCETQGGHASAAHRHLS